MKTPQHKPQPKPRAARAAGKQAPAAGYMTSSATAFAGGMRATDIPRSQRRPAKPGMLNTGNSDQADAFESIDYLGEGFAVVKLRPSKRQGEQFVQPDLPRMKAVTFRRVKSLLKKIADAKPAVVTDGAAAQADNDAFSASLQEEAMRWRTRLHEEGKLLASSQLCERLRVSRQSLSKAIAEQRLFALDGPGGRKLYPAFFGDASLPRRDLERAAQSLGPLPGALKWQFFTTPTHSLGGKTPVEALSRGKLDDVLRAAAGFLEREFGN